MRGTASALAAAAAAAVVASARAAGPVWPQKGFDATHHARSPYQGPHANAAVSSTWDTGYGDGFTDYPVINDNGCLIAVDNGGRLFGACESDGTLAKLFEADTEFAGSPVGSPAIIGNQVIVPVANATVMFFNAEGGRREGYVRLLTLDNAPTGDIVVPDIAGDLNAMVTWAGKVMAFYTWPEGQVPSVLPEWSNPFPLNIAGAVIGKAAGQAPVVYVSCHDGKLYALSMLDGTQLWEADIAPGVIITESPAVSRDGASVFINVEGRGTTKLNAADGSVVWNYPTDDIVGGASIVIGQAGKLLVGSRNGQFFAFDQDSGDQLWNYDGGEAVDAQAIVDAAGYVYYGDAAGIVHCLDTVDGTVLWTVDTQASISGGLVIDDDHALYAATNGGSFVRIAGDPPAPVIPGNPGQFKPQWAQRGGTPQHSGQSTMQGPSTAEGGVGQVVWRYTASAEIQEGAVATASGDLIVPDTQGKVHAINGETGDKMWTYDMLDGFVFGEVGLSPGGTRVYVGSSDANVYALAVTTGLVLWKSPVDLAVQGSVTVSASDVVFVSCADGFVYSFKGVDGSLLFKFSTGAGESLFPPAMLYNGRTIVAGSGDGFVRAYDSADGSLKWRYQTHGAVLEIPCVHPVTSKVYLGAAQELVSLESDGDRIWSVPASETMGASPGCGNKHNLLYIGGSDGAMHAYDERTGDERWVFMTGDRIASNPVTDVEGDRLFVTSMDGFLYVLDAEEGNLLWKVEVGPHLHGDPVLLGDGSIVVTSEDAKQVIKVKYVPPGPTPSPTPGLTPGGDAGVAIAVVAIVGLVGYVGGGFAYSYVRRGKLEHPNAAFWGRVGGCCSGLVGRFSSRPVPTDYGKKAMATSSGGYHSGGAGGAGATAASSVPATGTGGGYGAL